MSATNLDDLAEALAEAERRVPPGSLWRHNKTNRCFRVVCLALDEVTLQIIVVYARSVVWCGVDGPNWSRRLHLWEDGRFTRVKERWESDNE